MPHHPPHARLTHHVPHRSRLRLKGLRGDRAGLQQVAERLSAAPGVGPVEVNAATGSLLVHHQAPLPDVLAYARDHAVLTLQVEKVALGSLSAMVTAAVGSLDRGLRQATGGQLSLPLLLSTTFLGMAGLQVLRGKAGLSALQLLLFAMHAATMEADTAQADEALAENALGELG